MSDEPDGASLEHIRQREGRRGPYYIQRPRRGEPTPAQLRVVNALSHGLRVSEAGTVLGISYETAKSHLKHAAERTAAKNSTHLVAICLRNHWIK